MKFFKKCGSRFSSLGSHLTDVYHNLYWQNSGLIRKYEKKKKPGKNCVPPLESNSLDDQLSHHIAFGADQTDDELIDYFINGGEVESDHEWKLSQYCYIFIIQTLLLQKLKYSFSLPQ